MGGWGCWCGLTVCLWGGGGGAFVVRRLVAPYYTNCCLACCTHAPCPGSPRRPRRDRSLHRPAVAVLTSRLVGKVMWVGFLLVLWRVGGRILVLENNHSVAPTSTTTNTLAIHNCLASSCCADHRRPRIRRVPCYALRPPPCLSLCSCCCGFLIVLYGSPSLKNMSSIYL